MLTIAVHPQMRRIGERHRLDELAQGHAAALSRLAPEFRTSDGYPIGPIDEPHVSRTPLRLDPGTGGTVVLVPPDKPGVRLAVNGKPLREPFVCTSEALRRGVLIELSGRVLVLLHAHPAIDEVLPRYGLVGDSGALQRVRTEIQRAAATTHPVLIRGESGTGKELVARALHAASSRATRSYTAFNIAALSPQTATAELFGHARGSFTGAVQEREGLFRAADGGTLFLDEIGEASAEVQVLLLRVLESGEIQPLGHRPGRKVDVRLLAATDTDLERAVLQGTFRVALLHRLAGHEIHIPPLRERRDDIPRLLIHFITQELRRGGHSARLDELAVNTSRWLPTRSMAALLEHEWRGNVRQLANVARRMVGTLLAGRAPLDIAAHLDAPDAGKDNTVSSAPPPTPGVKGPVRTAGQLSDDEIMEAMEHHGWQVSATARSLGISRKALYARIAQNEHLHRTRDLTAKALEDALAAAGGDIARAAGVLRVSTRALQLRLRELKLLS